MTDSYQSIYDAVRSRISNGDIGQAVADAMRSENLSHYFACAMTQISYDFGRAAGEHARPSAVYRPAISLDGNQWRALYGENLQDGVAGFGDSPELAMAAFDAAWVARLPNGLMSAYTEACAFTDAARKAEPTP